MKEAKVVVHQKTLERAEKDALISDLRAKLKIAEEALEFYADSFAIMDHIDGTYTIHDTWYQIARAALAKIREGK